MLELWCEKYRPKTVDDFVWASANLKAAVAKWLREGQTPNVLFSGGAGRGKTSLARLLVRALGIPPIDILDINASLERKVDDLTAMITNFTSTWAMGDSQMKYVILDEADRLSVLSQDFLRNEIESNHENCRFILTCNHRHKITTALHSRVQEFEFSALSRDEAAMRVASILIEESVEFDPENMLKYVDAYHPDLRKCINVMQQRTTDGVLDSFDAAGNDGGDQFIQLLAALTQGDGASARNVIRTSVTPDEYLGTFRFLFTNIEIFEGADKQDEILIIIRDGMWRHSTVGDTEINMAATMTEIAQAVRKA